MLQKQVSQLGDKLEHERFLLSQVRQQFMNSSLARVEQENDELRQSVRIADNELRLMLHEEEVGNFVRLIHACSSHLWIPQ